MSKLAEDYNKFELSLQTLQDTIQINLDDIDKLDLFKKQIIIIEHKIQEIDDIDSDRLSTLRSQKIKLVLKISDIEDNIKSATMLYQIGYSLTQKYNEFSNQKPQSKTSRLVDIFDGKIGPYFGASKASKLLLIQIKNTSLEDLAKIINEVCHLPEKNKVYVLNNSLVTKSNMAFYKFFKLAIATPFTLILRTNKAEIFRFTISDMLQQYVIYTFNNF